MHSNRSHDVVIRVYDAAGNVIETQEHAHALHRLWFRPDLSRPSAAAGLESSRGTEGPLYPADWLYLIL